MHKKNVLFGEFDVKIKFELEFCSKYDMNNWLKLLKYKNGQNDTLLCLQNW